MQLCIYLCDASVNSVCFKELYFLTILCVVVIFDLVRLAGFRVSTLQLV